MNEQDQFDLIFQIGDTLLKNGAEVPRIESTLSHLAEAFDFQEFEYFVLIHGFFMTARLSDKTVQARVDDVAISPINLGRIEAINDLSRKLSDKSMTPEVAKRSLARIQDEHFSSNILKIFAYGLGSASFCYVFGGTLFDAAGAFFIGIVLALYVLYITPKLKLSLIFFNITSSMLIAILALILVKIFPPLKLFSLVIGGIMPLVPGVPIVNSVRYLLNQDYMSGWAQLMNAVVIAFSISVGIGVILRIFA